MEPGTNRPPLALTDLPAPEKIFNLRRLGLEEFLLLVAGPGLVSLGITLGSGQWVLAPLITGRFGLHGLGWIILLAIILQVLYNIELARLPLATGETPAVALSRTWPGKWVWAPLISLSLLIVMLSGGWSINAGASLFTLVTGNTQQASDLPTVRLLATGILFSMPLIWLFARRIQRTLEFVTGFTIAFVLISLLIVSIFAIPLSNWIQTLGDIITPASPVLGGDFTWFSALVGFSALMSGMNFVVMSYYKEKGYAMSAGSGAHTGLFDPTPPHLEVTGRTFVENESNTRIWKRWFRLLLIDQWAIFFPGALLGWLLPSVLMAFLVQTPGAQTPNPVNIPTYLAIQLSKNFGPVLLGWGLVVGFIIIYLAQFLILELLVRNLVDLTFNLSSTIRRWTRNDPRLLSFALFLVMAGLSATILYRSVPDQLIFHSANLANGMALIFPLATLYLGRQLPRPARSNLWSHLVLVANTLFFGFFFVNYVFIFLTGQPWISF